MENCLDWIEKRYSKPLYIKRLTVTTFCYHSNYDKVILLINFVLLENIWTKRKWIWQSICTKTCQSVKTESDDFKAIWGNEKKNIQPRGNCFNWSESKLDDTVKYWFEFPCSYQMGFVCQTKHIKPYQSHWYMNGWY